MSPLSIYQTNGTAGIFAAVGRQGSGELISGGGVNLANLYTTCQNGIVLGPNNFSQRMFVKSIRSRFVLTNQSPVDMKITIIDFIPKLDNIITQSVSNQWTEGTTVNDFGGVDSTSVVTVGNSPLQFPQVTNVWKKINQTIVNIGSGAHHTHNLYNGCNRLLDMSKTFDDTAANTRNYLKGYSMVTLFIINGYPVDSSTSWRSSS